MNRHGAPGHVGTDEPRAVPVSMLSSELSAPRGATAVSRSGRVSAAPPQPDSPGAGGVALGFICLAVFTALGIFGLVRSRTGPVALSGDEALDDGALVSVPARVDQQPAAAPELVGATGEAAPGERPGALASRRRLRFRDGSIAILQSAETVLEPVSVENRRIVNVLRAGAARFEITKRPGRLFRVIGGDAIVEVLGTKFELARVGAGLRVHVGEGRVRVSWAGGERRLGRGESGVFPPEVATRRRVKRGEATEAEIAGEGASAPAAASAE